jgi:hypothetical protein
MNSADMSKLTITEALAQIKTIAKRVEQKERLITTNIARQERFKDPLIKDGGQAAVIAQQRQAIHDLHEEIIVLRAGILQANTTTAVTINGVTRTVQDWLTWRREVAPASSRLLRQMTTNLSATRQQAITKGLAVVSQGAAQKDDDVIVNIDEGALAVAVEYHETTLGALDGQLSLINATTKIIVRQTNESL